MGVMSTPPTGGMTLLKGANKGSVGRTMKLKGKRFISTWGYHVNTMRKMNKKIISPSTPFRAKTPRTDELIGCKKLYAL